MNPDRDGDRISLMLDVDREFAEMVRSDRRDDIVQRAESAKAELRICAVEAKHMTSEASQRFQFAINAIEDAKDAL